MKILINKDENSIVKLSIKVLYLVKLSFRTEGERKSSLDKQKLKEFTTTKLALQNLLKGLFQSENKWWQLVMRTYMKE